MSEPHAHEDTQSLGGSSDPRERARMLHEQLATTHPEHIGPYKILQVLGEGGMGIVYLAEQEKPIHRRVAVKVIKLGMDTKEVVRRFETEREALALMNHSNVARALDAGATGDGRPYFVMEYIAGVRITEYCDLHRLNTEERLQLLIPVCRAIQHAHQKGIIHRDIKPSNVLVTLQEGAPIPKVIDFGVAKATQKRLIEGTFFTEFGQLIGTPGYMSPEQAEMTALDVDTRSDIYSLGVLLYELLVGEAPFDATLLQASLAEIHRIIREVDPPKPSTRLSTLKSAPGAQPAGALGDIAKRRRTAPNALIRELRGDLDWVIMKCLEKDRTRRYETADGLAQDLERFLDHRPVLAGPPNPIYRLRKFVRRHRVSALAGAGIIASLAAGTIVSTRLYWRAEALLVETRQERQHVAEKEREASTRAAEAEAVTRFLTRLLASADPRIARGRDLTVKDLLNKAGREIHETTSFSPAVETRLRQTIGNSLLAIGQFETAEDHLQIAVERLKKIYGPQHLTVAEALRDLAAVYDKQRKSAEAERALQQQLEIYAVQGLGAENPRVLRTRSDLGVMLWRKGAYVQAEAIWRDLLPRVQRLSHADALIATSLERVAEAAGLKGEYDEAKTLQEQALAKRRIVYGNDDPSIADTLNDLGIILWESGALDQARSTLFEALQLLERLFGADNPDIAVTYSNLAEVELRLGNLRSAREYAERAADSVRRSSEGDPVDRAHVQITWAAVLLAEGDPLQAERELREAIAMLSRFHSEDDWVVASTNSLLGETLAALGETAQAEQLLTKSEATLAKGYAAKSMHAKLAKQRLDRFLDSQRGPGETKPLEP